MTHTPQEEKSRRMTEKPAAGQQAASGNGMQVLSYLLAGIGFYGAIGWVADKLFHAVWCLPVGLLLGMAAAIYLIVKRFGERR